MSRKERKKRVSIDDHCQKEILKRSAAFFMSTKKIQKSSKINFSVKKTIISSVNKIMRVVTKRGRECF